MFVLEYNIDNDVFTLMAEAPHNKKRYKGYYICSKCGEFIKAVPKKTALCPFCGQEVHRIMYLDSVQEHITVSIWLRVGIYSDIRFDKKGVVA